MFRRSDFSCYQYTISLGLAGGDLLFPKAMDGRLAPLGRDCPWARVTASDHLPKIKLIEMMY